MEKMILKTDPWGRGKTCLGMPTLRTHWLNQVGPCLMFEVIDLKKNTNNHEVEEIAMDKYESSLEIIAEKGLQAALTLTRLLKGSCPSSSAK